MTNLTTHRAGADGRPRPCRVLVVDDHADTADLTARVLRGRGYAARPAGGYAAALAAARAGPVELLVCDLRLADGDGCDLLAAVRAVHPRVRGVALTGYGSTADRERCEWAGFVRFLLKPVALADLWDGVDAVARGLPCASASADRTSAADPPHRT